MNKKNIVITIFLIAIIAIIYILYMIYFADFIKLSEDGVPLSVYNEYFFRKISDRSDDARYFLNECKLENRTKVFGIISGRVFYDTNEIYFDSNGNWLCKNYYIIDCRDRCPRCLNTTLYDCRMLLGK